MRSPLLLRASWFLVVFAVAVVIGWKMLRPSEGLPVFHPAQLDARLVDADVRQKKGEHRIQPFVLTDQLGRTVTLDETIGKVVLADFFFATCTSICPKMGMQMARVQAAYANNDRVLLLSHSVTPEMDTVPVLRAYGEQFGADPERWRLLTGPRNQINALARRSYFAAMEPTPQGSGALNDLVHTENFVLVDTLGRIRGFYDGTSSEEVDKAITDIAKLLRRE
jgi:protein SCO1